MRLRHWAVVALLAVGAAACSGAEASGPPQVELGRDMCFECGMVIEDARFVASYRLPDGSEKSFDDIGGLIVHGREGGELDDATVWVADFETEQMLDAPAAFFVPTLAVASPMGHGILAFGSEQAANEFAGAIDGSVLRWPAVRDLPLVEGRVGHHHEHEATEDMADHEMDSEQ